MSTKNFSLLAISLIFASCGSPNPKIETNFCGIKMTSNEYSEFRNKADRQESPYEFDSDGQIYRQLNDSIRAAMPDTLEFEIFLSYLDKEKVGVDVYCPKNEKYFETISCAVMNSNFPKQMPRQRFLCIYSYTNDDGSGELPLELAVRRKEY